MASSLWLAAITYRNGSQVSSGPAAQSAHPRSGFSEQATDDANAACDPRREPRS